MDERRQTSRSTKEQNDPAVDSVEVAESLVREFLAKNGYQKAFEAFEKERPRGPNAIGSRTVLAKVLGVEKLAKRNKAREHPLCSLLEIIVDHLAVQAAAHADAADAPAASTKGAPSSKASDDREPRRSATTVPTTKISSSSSSSIGGGGGLKPVSASAERSRDMDRDRDAPSKAKPGRPISSSWGLSDNASATDGSREPAGRAGSARPGGRGPVPSRQEPEDLEFDDEADEEDSRGGSRGKPAVPSRGGAGSQTNGGDGDSSGDERGGGAWGNSRGGSGGLSRPMNRLAVEDDDDANRVPMKKAMGFMSPARDLKVPVGRPVAAASDLQMEDVGDEDLGAEEFDAAPNRKSSKGPGNSLYSQSPGETVTGEAARKMKALLFGNHGMPGSWRQGFFFSDVLSLPYGLVQLKGGPCGVLASVQAHILRHIYKDINFKKPVFPEAARQKALTVALARCIWRCGDQNVARLVLVSDKLEDKNVSYDHLMRIVKVFPCTSRVALEALIAAHVHQFMDPQGHGILLLLTSLILTRGISTVVEDMDDPNNALMGAHGYCTQDLVNLVNLGHAHSNVFDRELKVDDLVMRGVYERAEVGLLTLFEHFKYVEVGHYLKEPMHPIWVVCSESHFSVLFTTDANAIKGRCPFDLFYYDGLSRQEDLIRLTIGTHAVTHAVWTMQDYHKESRMGKPT
eukprot:jgi/Mesvir1/28177/Mv04737-RA.3